MTFAYWGLVSFLFVYCARPSDWLGRGMREFPFAKITAGIAILGLLAAMLTGGRKFLHLPKEVILIFFLFGWLCLSVPFSVWPGGSFDTVFVDFSKVIPIVILIVSTANTPTRLRLLFTVQTASVATIAVLTLMGRSNMVGLSQSSDVVRFGGAIGGIFGNPNDFAWALSLVLPFAFALMLHSRNIFTKSMWAMSMVVMVIAAMKTYSRGGVICMIVSGGITIWLFGVRARKPQLIVGAAVAGLLVLAFFSPPGFFQRVSSTTDWAEDATGSAWARQHLFQLSLRYTLENPLFGVGPGNFTIVSGSWHGTHNTFTQFSSEAGIPAAALFIIILWYSVRNLRTVRKWMSDKDDLWVLSAGLSASFAGFIVGGFFGMAAYHFFAYFMIGYACAIYRLAQNARAASSPDQPVSKKPSISRRSPRREDPEDTAAPDYSRVLRRSWRTVRAPLPARTSPGD